MPSEIWRNCICLKYLKVGLQFSVQPWPLYKKISNFLTQYLGAQEDIWDSYAPWSSALLVSVSYFIFSKVRLMPACLALKLCGNFICRRNKVIYDLRNWVLWNCLRTDDNTRIRCQNLLCWPVLVSANF